MSNLSLSQRLSSEFLSAVQTVERARRDLVLGQPRASSIGQCPTAIWAAMHGVAPTVVPDGGTYYVMAKGKWAEEPTKAYLVEAGWHFVPLPQVIWQINHGEGFERPYPIEGRPDGCCWKADVNDGNLCIWERKDASVDRYVELAEGLAQGQSTNAIIQANEPGWYDQVQVYLGRYDLHLALLTVFCQDQSVSRERLQYRLKRGTITAEIDPLVLFILVERDKDRIAQLVEKAQMIRASKMIPVCSVPHSFCPFAGTSYCGSTVMGGGVRP